MVELETTVVFVQSVELVVDDLGHAGDAPGVHEERRGAIGDEKRKGDPLHVLGLPTSGLQRVLIGGEDAFLDLRVLDPLDFGHREPVSLAEHPSVVLGGDHSPPLRARLVPCGDLQPLRPLGFPAFCATGRASQNVGYASACVRPHSFCRYEAE